MTCPRCQDENPPGSNFCLGCGARLGATCGACGNDLPVGSRFCNKCGIPVSGESAGQARFPSPESYTPKHLVEKILTSRTALEGERKQGTVPFVDVPGFPSLSERLDPEEVHRLMSRAFDLMLAEVHRYEGTVNQFLGDGIMALFGAPIAHEDHARRAVQAALGIGRALEDYQRDLVPRGISFRARQGLNTGLVVVGSIGSDLRMDYTAVGDTTNVAARLQQAGEPGRVTISEATLRLVRGYFDSRPLGEIHLKGKAESVTAWEVVAAHETRTRLEVEADRGLTPFVGRERELAEVGGSPGPVAPYLRALLSVDPGDADVRAMSPAQRRGETFEALRRLLVRAGELRPQVLVIEDLHWTDGATEQFLAALVDSIPALRALLVFTYRPGYANPFGERSYFTRIVLAALSIEDSARMAAAVLAVDELPDDLRMLIAGKAEGNPFYVEELVKSLEESGILRRVERRYELTRPVSEIAIPGTIHDVIAARIDRLAEAPKRTLQLAAVIGREFTRRLVDRLAEIRERTGDFLRELTVLELIHERRVFPELAYMFKHALTQDVAYASLLVQRRKELHQLVGLAIEELYADRLVEHYEVLAHHFLRAEDWKRALDYLLKAAEKATKAFGLRQAIELYGEALEAARRLGDGVPVTTLMTIHRARADLFHGVFELDRSRAEAEALVDLARRVGDRPAEAGALVQVASALQWAEDFPTALQRAGDAIEIAEAVGAPAPLAGGLFIRGYVHAVNGRLEAAEEDVGRALNIGRAVGDASRQALALHLLALRRSWQGQYREGLDLGGEGVRIAREHRLVIPLLRCLWNQGASWSEIGDYDAALAALSEGLALAEKIGDDAFIPRFLNTLGWLHIDCGDFARGVELSEQSYEVTARSSRAGHGTGAERRTYIRNNEADALMVQGDLAGAGEALKEAHDVVQHPPPDSWMNWFYSIHCFASLAQLALQRGDPDRARRHADQSLEMATPTKSRKYESWAWRIKGESATVRRAWEEAEEALRRALAIAQSIGQPRQIWMSQAALGRRHAARGRRAEAYACHRA